MKTRKLPVKLTEVEIYQYGDQLSRAVTELEDLQIRHKDAKAEMKRAEDKLQGAISRLAEVRKSGQEHREVEIIEMPDLGRGVMDTVRADTRELIETRPLTDAEICSLQQTSIPGLN